MSDLPLFQQHPLVRGPFLQTIIGSQRGVPPSYMNRKCHKLKLAPKSFLMIFEYPPKDNTKPIVVLAHGMGGCSDSNYMLRVGKLLAWKGYGVILMNHRGSGIGMGLSEVLWNGGSSADLGAVIDFVLRIHPNRLLYIIGFSLSGNILLKYLGEGRSISPYLFRALAINPPIDLRTSSILLSYHPRNRIFNNYYIRIIRNQGQALSQCFPDALHPNLNAKTIWDFDVTYTAPAAGFRDVENYYYKSSANQYLSEVPIPTTILASSDDPFIPVNIFHEYPYGKNVKLIETNGGGHMGYISRLYQSLPDCRWMDHFILNWVEQET